MLGHAGCTGPTLQHELDSCKVGNRSALKYLHHEAGVSMIYLICPRCKGFPSGAGREEKTKIAPAIIVHTEGTPSNFESICCSLCDDSFAQECCDPSGREGRPHAPRCQQRFQPQLQRQGRPGMSLVTARIGQRAAVRRQAGREAGRQATYIQTD